MSSSHPHFENNDTLNVKPDSFLWNHVVQDIPILPGVAYVDICLHMSSHLKTLKFMDPCKMEEKVRVTCDKNIIRIGTHAQAEIVDDTPFESVVIDIPKESSDSKWNADTKTFYDDNTRRGLHYKGVF